MAVLEQGQSKHDDVKIFCAQRTGQSLNHKLGGSITHMLNWFKNLKKTPEEKRREWDSAYAGYGPLSIASTQCIGPNRLPVRYARRDPPSHSHDTGWVLYSGKESDSFAGDPRNFVSVPLHRFVEVDSSLARIVESPVGSEWTRKPPEDIWRRILDGKVVDEDGRTIGETTQ